MGVMRKDAARSREALLRAVADMHAEEGTLPGMHALAARAGVGVGTLYRHFPTREDLMAGLAESRLAQLAELVEEAVAVDDAREAFEGLLGAVVAAGCDPALVRHVSTASGSTSGALLDRFDRGVDALLERARADGAVRPDVERTHLVALLHGLLATTADLGDDQAGRAVAVDVLARGLADGTP